jgi:hypothetical protein
MIFFAYRNETGTFFTRKIVVKVVQSDQQGLKLLATMTT